MAGSSAFRWTRTLGAIGYAIPIVTRFVPGSPGIPVPYPVMQILQPIINITSINIYPDWPAVLLFYAPVNAFLYGTVGLILGSLIRYTE